MQDIKRKCGVLRETPSVLLYDYETVCCGSSSDEIEIPDEYMLPEDRIPTCRDQGTTSQCVAFASAGILEIFNYIETGVRTLFSTSYIYGRHRKKSLRTVDGMFPSMVLKYLTLLGSIPNEMMPQVWDCPDAYDLVQNSDLEELDAIAQKTHISSYINLKNKHGITEKSILNIKKALLQYQLPIFASIKMYDAYHAICIVGWDKKRIYYMNSWGKNWGKNKDGICSFSPEDLTEAYLLLDAKNTPEFPFVDVAKEHWAYHPILRCYSAGIINGIDDIHFSPDTVLTRAHVTQALYRFAQKWMVFNGEEFIEPKNIISYNDVTPDKWFYKAVNYCAKLKLFDNTQKEFRPDEALSRGEFCRVIFEFMNAHSTMTRFAKLLEKSISDIEVRFNDVAENNENYESIVRCYNLGLINGVGETEFMPEASLTRAHLCQIVYKVIKLLEEYEMT